MATEQTSAPVGHTRKPLEMTSEQLVNEVVVLRSRAAAFANLIAKADAAATRLFQSDSAADRAAGDELIAAIALATGGHR